MSASKLAFKCQFAPIDHEITRESSSQVARLRHQILVHFRLLARGRPRPISPLSRAISELTDLSSPAEKHHPGAHHTSETPATSRTWPNFVGAHKNSLASRCSWAAAEHERAQRRAWLGLSYAQRLAWLEDAKRFAALHCGAAKRRRREKTKSGTGTSH